MAQQHGTGDRPRVTPSDVGADPKEQVYRRSGFGEAIKTWTGVWMAVIALFAAGLIAVVVFSTIY